MPAPPVIRFGLPTTPDFLINLMITQIFSSGVVADQSSIFITLEDDATVAKFEPGPDTFVTLRLAKLTQENGYIKGGGKSLPSFDLPMHVDLWRRYEPDLAVRATDFLTDSTNGILILWRKILKVLEIWVPLDSSLIQSYLNEPMRLLSFDTMPRTVKGGWSKFNSTWSCKFTYDLVS